MWNIYNKLIAQIPEDHYVTKIFQTERWALVENDQQSIGSAMRFPSSSSCVAQKWVGCSLKEVAELVKSWDFEEASIGLAAINSFFNSMDRVKQYFSQEQLSEQDTFFEIPELYDQYKVAMIGHFPYVDRYPLIRERLFIFELNPRPGDYPASAAEFLLPEMDYVFMTASALVNKTLPRLLTLSKRASVIVTGASCPLSPILFEEGVDRIGGTIYNESIQQVIEKKQKKQLHLSNCGKQIQVCQKGKK